MFDYDYKAGSAAFTIGCRACTLPLIIREACVMKIRLAVATLLAGTVAASAQYNSNNFGNSFGSSGLHGTGSNPSNHYVQPHYSLQGSGSSGGYISGHQQTNPNNTQFDNYSTRGNVNPYTGAVGTRTPRY
jgi:hypothetical protein